jgi:hypothetical protein
VNQRMKVPVSERALYARINRALAAGRLLGDNDLRLKKTKGAKARQDLGDFFVLNTRRNYVMHHYKDVDLEELGRDVGAIGEWEELNR